MILRGTRMERSRNRETTNSLQSKECESCSLINDSEDELKFYWTFIASADQIISSDHNTSYGCKSYGKTTKYVRQSSQSHSNPNSYPQLGDFGLGVGLYFSILRYVSLLTFICGLISIGNIQFYDSDHYLPESYRMKLPLLLRGSATCNKRSWVPCSTCECVPESIRLTAEELKASPYLPTERCKVVDNVTYALRNECGEIPIRVGLTHLATVIVFLVALFALGIFIERETKRFDEDEQTAQDYSIRISNPREFRSAYVFTDLPLLQTRISC